MIARIAQAPHGLLLRECNGLRLGTGRRQSYSGLAIPRDQYGFPRFLDLAHQLGELLVGLAKVHCFHRRYVAQM